MSESHLCELDGGKTRRQAADLSAYQRGAHGDFKKKQKNKKIFYFVRPQQKILRIN